MAGSAGGAQHHPADSYHCQDQGGLDVELVVRDRSDLGGDLMNHGLYVFRSVTQEKSRSTRILTEFHSDWPLERE